MKINDFSEGQLRSMRNQSQKEIERLLSRVSALKILYSSIDHNVNNTKKLTESLEQIKLQHIKDKRKNDILQKQNLEKYRQKCYESMQNSHKSDGLIRERMAELQKSRHQLYEQRLFEREQNKKLLMQNNILVAQDKQSLHDQIQQQQQQSKINLLNYSQSRLQEQQSMHHQNRIQYLNQFKQNQDFSSQLNESKEKLLNKLIRKQLNEGRANDRLESLYSLKGAEYNQKYNNPLLDKKKISKQRNLTPENIEKINVYSNPIILLDPIKHKQLKFNGFIKLNRKTQFFDQQNITQSSRHHTTKITPKKQETPNFYEQIKTNSESKEDGKI